MFYFYIFDLNMNEWVSVKGRMKMVLSNSVFTCSYYRFGAKT